MKIVYIHGNLLETPYEVILHGCNAQGVQNSGVARGIREKFNNAYLIYRKEYLKNGLTLGDIIIAPDKDKIIIHGITQKFYGRDKKCYVDYEAINKVMESVNKFAKDNGFTQVAMPLIGAGLGGGSWRRIANIIENAFTDVTPVVYTLDGVIPNT